MSQQPRILLIEDQKDTQRIVRAVFGTDVELLCAETLAEADRLLAKHTVDLVLLDGTLPDGDGFTYFAQLRRNANMVKTPIIFLTARSEINDRVAAFAMGAEDYIVKPLEPREFRARVQAKLKRVTQTENDGILNAGSLRIDRHRLRSFRVAENGEATELFLTPYEFKILAAFMENQDSVLTRDQLISVAWGDSVHVLERTVDRHVSGLRKKLGVGPERILPVHGVGYRFDVAEFSAEMPVADLASRKVA